MRATICVWIAFFFAWISASAEPTGEWVVNSNSRAEVRAFYNAVYFSSDGVPMETTADVARCIPGTNSQRFTEAVLRRINWFRAMAGVPAEVAFDPGYSEQAQVAALMMSAQKELSHVPAAGWACWSAAGSNAASHANLTIDRTGPDAITSYFDDYGSSNEAVGHRRWLLYPQTRVMGTGDVPGKFGFPPANATWVQDENLGGPRPLTRQPEVTWPPAGFVPYPVVFRRWSFAFPGAGFSGTTVSMRSNGVPITVTRAPVVNGYGENTVVWVPAGLNPNTAAFSWARPVADTVYTVTVSNVLIRGYASNFTYAVTVFDPDLPGPNETLTTVSGASTPALDRATAYRIQPVPYATRYEWRAARRSSLTFNDGAENGLTNFIANTTPGYAVILAGAGVGRSRAFHLAHTIPATPQALKFRMVLSPATNGAVLFRSRLGFSGNGQFARVQASTDDANSWADLYAQRGTGGAGETAYANRSVPLGRYSGQSIQLRFLYDFVSGNFFSLTNANAGWLIDNVVLTNCSVLWAQMGGAADGTNFYFAPPEATNFVLEARGFMADEFGLSWGPGLEVRAVVPPRLFAPAQIGSQWQIEFTPGTLANPRFQLQRSMWSSGAWNQDATATLSTNAETRQLRFTTSTGSNGQEYFRVTALSSE